MQRFSITRIHTTQGIFRISGEWAQACDDKDENRLRIVNLDMMSTDGWVELDIQQDKCRTLIDELKAQILQHLQDKTKATLSDKT
ncbi:hypothetical protein EKG38_06660 [Shewanella canadensis]|uniref:Uncharacterized protein n=1 Tax=Shewanella canadensis TaxID=271096 RepID=A0A3S0LN84_9GAMM|nr:hypothetical protein [Shewanella canadensis]RTR39484.1 hypothetical protein EKG38_06660 [Shewanella canadensis]